MVRFGKLLFKNNIAIYPPRIDQLVESYQIYEDIYQQSIADDIMTEDEMLSWMKESLIWTKANEARVDTLTKELEQSKVDIYESRQDPKKVKNIRNIIRQKETDLHKEFAIKNSQYEHTCEGIASTARVSWLISNTTYQHGKLYDFQDISLNQIVSLWQESILSDTQCRELVRNDPWRSMWSIAKNGKARLFFNKEDEDLTLNQKSMVVWSQIYDNIYESIDCPSKGVIEDDDMLDGWLIVQNRKHEKSRIESESQDLIKNPKIKNSKEVLIMAHSKEHAKNIHNLNDEKAKEVIKQRFAAVEKHGTLNQEDLPDEKMNIHLHKMQSLKEHLK